VKNVKLFSKILLLITALYLVLSISFYFFHEKLVFRPDRLAREYIFQFDQSFEEYFIPMQDSVEVNALMFKSTQPTKRLILYFHGNKDNLQRWGNYAPDLTKHGYDVLMTEYRGYGKSGGEPGEAAFYRDAESVYLWVKGGFDYDTIVIYGRSLGSAVASNLAMKVQPDLLILETPFDELWGVVYPIFQPGVYFAHPNIRFSNAEHLRTVRSRKVIIHGTRDWVVPFSSVERLQPFLQQGDEFIIIEGGGHNNLNHYPEYHSAIANALR
jgi:uncharacterized protein